jgi:hypothetical protein
MGAVDLHTSEQPSAFVKWAAVSIREQIVGSLWHTVNSLQVTAVSLHPPKFEANSLMGLAPSSSHSINITRFPWFLIFLTLYSVLLVLVQPFSNCQSGNHQWKLQLGFA